MLDSGTLSNVSVWPSDSSPSGRGGCGGHTVPYEHFCITTFRKGGQYMCVQYLIDQTAGKVRRNSLPTAGVGKLLSSRVDPSAKNL